MTDTLDIPAEAEAEAEVPTLGDMVAAAMDADGVPGRMAEVLGAFYDAVETLQRLAEVRASLPAYVESADAIIRLAEDGLAEYPDPVLPAVRALVAAAGEVLTTTLPRAGGTRSTRPAGERATQGGFSLPPGQWIAVEDAAGEIVIREGEHAKNGPRWDSLGSRFKDLLDGQTLKQAFPVESVAARDAILGGSLAATVGDYTIRVMGVTA